MLENQLKKSFSLSEFRIGQKEIINTVLAKKDAMAVLPTGGGKSLCYQFPAVHLKQLVVVVSPLIALMRDQVRTLKERGIPAGSVHSGQTEDERREVAAGVKKGGPYILYLSPERVAKEGFQKWIMGRKIALFAVDEAHCVSQWGHDFREEYAQLNVLKTLRPDVPILALTASATPMVLDDIAKNLKLVDPARLVHGFYRPNLYYQVETCLDDEDKMRWLFQSLREHPTGRVLIYCGTRKVTEDVSHTLQKHFEKVGFYHAGLSTEERTSIQNQYASGELRILAATNAFGMGIDQPDVRLVVHYQLPANIDSLYQEMGRAGRDGADSTCLLLYSKKDKGLQGYFIQTAKAKKAIKELRWRNLDALVAYAEGGECRHGEILTYYKDAQRLPKCGHCDACDPASLRKVQTPPIQPVTGRTLSGPVKPAPVKLKKTKSAYDVKLDPDQDTRFQALREWRKAKALELDIPAFVVFGDKTLREIAVKNPQSVEDLNGIYGIGEAKLEQFGHDLIAELNK